MKSLSAFKYLVGFSIPLLTWYSFKSTGWLTFLPLLYTFAILPLLELVLSPDATNFTEKEEARRLDNVLYDLLIYLVLPVQLLTVFFFLNSMQEEGLTFIDKAGRVISMGLCCGVLGINVGHELGHRPTWYEKCMAKLNLMTSLNMHFMQTHNNHHHRVVSTPEDPSSARFGEPLYTFWIRSITGVYKWSWILERNRLKQEGIPFMSLKNRMITDHLIEAGFLAAIGLFFGWAAVGYFVIAALIGHLILETVNYIEHYGLRREKKGNRYERVTPLHSWNSDHVLGRLHLFELSRHSDHHYRPGRNYQILRHMDESPQMPTGYPGMMLLSTVPPLWFRVMNPRIARVKNQPLSKI
jgi:alkane 1-monooxygenase